jgi:hypothetical protein
MSKPKRIANYILPAQDAFDGAQQTDNITTEDRYLRTALAAAAIAQAENLERIANALEVIESALRNASF